MFFGESILLHCWVIKKVLVWGIHNTFSKHYTIQLTVKIFQVESRYFYKIPGDWPRMGQNEESPEKIHKVLDDNVEQISSVSTYQFTT